MGICELASAKEVMPISRLGGVVCVTLKERNTRILDIKLHHTALFQIFRNKLNSNFKIKKHGSELLGTLGLVKCSLNVEAHNPRNDFEIS